MFVFQAEDGIRDYKVTGVQTCALPICFRALLRRRRACPVGLGIARHVVPVLRMHDEGTRDRQVGDRLTADRDRKSTRLNSSHLVISYAVFCLKKKKTSYPSPTAVASAPSY